MIKFEEIIKQAKGVKLSKREKSELRAILFARIGISYQPVPRPVLFRFFRPIPIPILASFLALALLGSGVSFAAEGSLPGDVLYPVKLKINEEIKSTLALSAQSKADWEAKRLERRLEEAEKLSVAGRLDEKAKAKIESNFEKHAEKTQARIAQLEAKADVKSASEISSKLETSLRSHGRILRKFSEAEPAVSMAAFQSEAVAGKMVTEGRISEKNKPEIEEAAEGKLKSAENKIKETRRFIEKHKNSATTEIKLKLAEEIIVEGKKRLSEKKYGEAFLLFQKASRVAQDAKSDFEDED